MKKIIISLTILLALFLNVSAIEFKPLLKFHKKIADRSFDRLAYYTAVKHYDYVYSHGYKDSIEVVRNIAISYHKIGEVKKASVYYSRAIDSLQSTSVQDYYNYAQVLRNIGDYQLADAMVDKGSLLIIESSNDNKFLQRTSDAIKLIKPHTATVRIADFNSENSDFGAVRYNNGVVFASARKNQNIVKFKYKWKDQPYLDLYFYSDTARSEKAIPFSSALNSIFHEGPICFSKDGNQIFFTRNNNRYGLLAKRDTKGVNNLKIYHSELVDGKWTNVESLSFNSEDYSCGHPALSNDGNILYFVSDKPGGFGGTDVYYSEKMAYGWSEPKNLGLEINTSGNEMFPFVDSSNRLFFASDGHVSLGGLDIFVAMPVGSNTFANVNNLGAPVNSEMDDFGFFLIDSKTGYISSNRVGGKGDDDIYKVNFSDDLVIDQLLTVIVKDIDTKKTIDNAIVTLGDKKENISHLTKGGAVNYNIRPGNEYAIAASKDGYKPATDKLVVASTIVEPVERVLYMKAQGLFGLKGIVSLNSIDNPFPGVSVNVIDKAGDKRDALTADKGDFFFDLKENTDYKVILTKDGFFTISVDVTTRGMNEGIIDVNKLVNLAMEKIEKDKTIEIPNIYYDLGKWAIRKDASIELDKVVEFLQNNPSISVELGSHTDARGSDRSNETLSQKRAESAVAYIVAKGVLKNRIAAKGYGETKIKNECKEGVKCAEKLHQANRRTEIMVTDILDQNLTIK